MSMSRRLATVSVPAFGRRAQGFVMADVPRVTNLLSDDARLFVLTFAGGFLFMAVYLA